MKTSLHAAAAILLLGAAMTPAFAQTPAPEPAPTAPATTTAPAPAPAPATTTDGTTKPDPEKKDAGK